MNNHTITISRADYRLLERCKQIVEVTNLIDADPQAAFDQAVALPIEPETRQLREAVVMHASRVCAVKKVADSLAIPWIAEGV